MPVVVAAVVVAAAAVTTVGVVAAVALGVAAAVATNNFMKKLGAGSVADVAQANQELSTGTSPRARMIVGEAVVSGSIIKYAKVSHEDNNEYHHMFVPLCMHPSESVSLYQLEGKSQTSLAGNGYYIEARLGDQTGPPSRALQYMSNVDETFIGTNVTDIYGEFIIDPDVFPNGLQDLKFLVKGLKVYDPRKDTTAGGSGSHRIDDESTWEWTDNAALINFYWKKWGGYPLPEQMFDLDNIAEEANLCDELVDYIDKDGETQQQKRYTCNGTIDLTESHETVEDKLLSSCGGRWIESNGAYRLQVAVYRGPELLTITQQDIKGEIDWTPHVGLRDRCNKVVCSIISKDHYYQATEVPPVESTFLRDQRDGGKSLEHDTQLHYTNDEATAQRLNVIRLLDNSAGNQLRIPMGIKALYCRAGQVIRLELTSPAVTGEFEVHKQEYDWQRNRGFIEVKETSPSIFDSGQVPVAFDVTPNDAIDNANIAPVQNVALVVTPDDTQSNGNLTWTHPAPKSVINYTVFVYTQPGNQLVRQGASTSEYFELGLLPLGNYRAVIRAKNLFNKLSDHVNYDFTVGEIVTPDPEPDVPAEFLYFRPKPFTLNVPYDYEFWYGTTDTGDEPDMEVLTRAPDGKVLDVRAGIELDTVYYIYYRIFTKGIRGFWLKVTRTSGEGIGEASLSTDILSVIERAGVDGVIDQSIGNVSSQLATVDSNAQAGIAGTALETINAVSKYSQTSLDLISEVSSLQGLVVSLNETVGQLQVTGTGVTATQISALQIDINANTASISFLTTTQNNISDSVALHTSQIEQNSNSITLLQESIGEGEFSTLGVRLDGQDNKITQSAISAQLTNLELINEISSGGLNRLDAIETTEKLAIAQTEIQALTDEISATASSLVTVATTANNGYSLAQELVESVSTLDSQLTTNVNTLTAQINEEESARTSEVTRLDQAIVDEALDRQVAISVVSGKVDHPTTGLVASYSLAQSASYEAGVNGLSITILGNQLNHESTGLAATLQLATTVDTRTQYLATFSLETDVNGFTSGIYNQNDGTTADLKIKTNNFEIVDATTGISILKRSAVSNTWEFDGNLIAAGGTFTGTLVGVDGEFSGRITSTEGFIGGWIINSDKIISKASGRRIELDSNESRISVLDHNGIAKVVMGYLSGIPKNDGTGYFSIADYGFWAKPGDALVIDGQVEYNNGEFILQQDGAMRVFDGSAEVFRIGYGSNDQPDNKGIYAFDGAGTNESNVIFKFAQNFVRIGRSATDNDWLFFDPATNTMSIKCTSISAESGSYKGDIHDDANVRGTIDGVTVTLSDGTKLTGADLVSVGGTFDGIATVNSEIRGHIDGDLGAYLTNVTGSVVDLTGTLNNMAGSFVGTHNGNYEIVRSGKRVYATDSLSTIVWYGDDSIAKGSQSSTNGDFVYGQSGTVYIKTLNVTDTLTETSDRRVKENITELTGGLARVLQYRPVSYQRIGSKRLQCGLIAQDAEKVHPSLVVTNPETGLKSLSYTAIIPDLILGEQELYTQAEQIKTDVHKLQQQIEQFMNSRG